MKPNGQDKKQNKDLAEAIRKHADEKAEREPLLADQGKMKGGLDEPKV